MHVGPIEQTFLTLFLLLSSANTSEATQPVPIDQSCAGSDHFDRNWTAVEKFVWRKVCVGSVADLNKPDDPEVKSRVLRSAFLEEILLKEQYRNALTRLGVRIIGAQFDSTIDLKNATLDHELSITKSTLAGGADFSGLTSSQGIELRDDTILTQPGDVTSIDLEGAHIQGSLDLGGNTIV